MIRGQVQVRDGPLVPHGVGGDAAAAGEAVEHALAQVGAISVQQRGAAREVEHRPDDHGAPGEGERGGAFAEKRDGGQRREQRARAARQRVNEGEVAMPVAALEQEGIGGLDHAAADEKQQGEPGQGRFPPQPVDRNRREVEGEGEQARQPHEGQAAAGAFRRIILGRVRERGDEHDAEGQRGHAAQKPRNTPKTRKDFSTGERR
jgi:hypothetical protein